MQLLNILLMMDPQGKNSSTMSLVFVGLMILVFWLFMIRPQAKKAKEQKNFINQMKKGDKVVNVSGLHGKIISIDNGTVMLELDANVKVG
jgi:preprotein translocase subunit YajC